MIPWPLRFPPPRWQALLLLCLFAAPPVHGARQQRIPQTAPDASPTTAALPSTPALAQARALMQAGHFAEAEPLLRQELVRAPPSARVHAALAYCLLRQNKPAEALSEYTAAAALQPPDAEQLTEVGQAYVLLGDDADADHWTFRAVQANPNDAQAWYSLGRIRYTEQRFADALTCFEHVLALQPHNVRAENNLGLSEEGLNHPEAATAAYRQAIAWETGAPEAGDEQPYLNLAILLLHSSRFAEAEPLLHRAVALSPHDARIQEQLGHLYLQQGNAAAAAEAFGNASRLDPQNGSLHFLLGQAYRRLGRKEQADLEFAEAARLSAKSPDAKN